MIVILSKNNSFSGYLYSFFNQKNIDVKILSLFHPIVRSNNNELIEWDDFITEINSIELVIVAFKDRDESRAAIEFLSTAGITRDILFDFFKMYDASIPILNCEKRIVFRESPSYKGIVLGISHSEVSILEHVAKDEIINLSHSHQDIYYNNCVLTHMLKEYPDAFKSLEYAVIDLFDYTYFNLDTSKSEIFHHYLQIGGYALLDKHNYDLNKNFTTDFDALINYLYNEKFGDISESDLSHWETYFNDYHSYDNFSGFLQPTKKNLPNMDEFETFGYGSVLYKTYNDTINENIELFRKLLETLYSVNKDIKIHLIVIPRYETLEKRDLQNELVQKWKVLFYQIIDDIKASYPVKFWDFKTMDFPLNKNISLFADPAHFNYYGAIHFTKYLDRLIHENTE